MKTRFIRIDDISQIDTSKITPLDLANRYIDKYGNMYGLRYNKATKKIEIVRIMRTTSKQAHLYWQKMQKKTEKTETQIPITPTSSTINHNDNLSDFNPEICINAIIETVKIHKNRLHGMISSITNANLIPQNDKLTWNTINDYFRNLDMDGIQALEKIEDTYNEFINYPRSLTYYQSKLDTKHREILDAIPYESSKLKYVKYYEIWYQTKTTYKAIIKILSDIRFVLEQQHIEEKRHLTPLQKQTYFDALTSIDNTIAEANKILSDCTLLENVISSSKLFT